MGEEHRGLSCMKMIKNWENRRMCDSVFGILFPEERKSIRDLMEPALNRLKYDKFAFFLYIFFHNCVETERFLRIFVGDK